MIYVVTAYRWGWLNEHRYLVWATPDREKAIEMAREECMGRGGKYGVEVDASGFPDGTDMHASRLPLVDGVTGIETMIVRNDRRQSIVIAHDSGNVGENHLQVGLLLPEMKYPYRVLTLDAGVWTERMPP